MKKKRKQYLSTQHWLILIGFKSKVKVLTIQWSFPWDWYIYIYIQNLYQTTGHYDSFSYQPPPFFLAFLNLISNPNVIDTKIIITPTSLVLDQMRAFDSDDIYLKLYHLSQWSSQSKSHIQGGLELTWAHIGVLHKNCSTLKMDLRFGKQIIHTKKKRKKKKDGSPFLFQSKAI